MELFELLLESTKSNLVGVYFPTLSSVVVDSAAEYLSRDDLILPYNPAREIPGGALLDLFEKHFPKRRTTVSVTDIFFEYKIALGLLAKHQFDVTRPLTNRYTIEVALHRAHQKYDFSLDSHYFHDDHVAEILNPKNVIKKSILSIDALLGRSPTAREYQQYRTLFDGPSLSYVKCQFESFNDAKRFAGVGIWEKGGKKADFDKK